MVVGLLTATSFFLLSAGRALAADFPPFLTDPESFTAEIRAEIVAVWSRHTFARTVTGEPARAPLELYRLFVDAPEVVAAAARHLGLVKYQVRQLGPDFYEADDGEGAKGSYRVIAREPHRRVMLTRGSHSGHVLGWVQGASLTILTFEPETRADRAPQIAQQVETFVRIDNPMAALLARVFLPLFMGYADRRIAETFNVTAQISQWAYGEPTTFCRWLGGRPEGARHRGEFAPVLPACN